GQPRCVSGVVVRQRRRTLGFVGLVVLSVMTAVNLPLLVGGSDTLAAIIGVLLAGAFLGGIAVAIGRPHAGNQDENPDIAKEIAQ
ncbi:hypothetical protein ABFW12_33005, partial [Mycolicibacterium porcinum]